MGPHAMSRCLVALAHHLDAPAAAPVPSNASAGMPRSGIQVLKDPTAPPPNDWNPDLSALDLDGMIGQLLSARKKRRGTLVNLKADQIRLLTCAARQVLLKQPSLLELD